MNVLLVNGSCKVGGVSTFLLALQSALMQLAHRCEIFFFEHGPMEERLPRNRPIRFGTLEDLLRLVDREKFTVVHGNNVDWITGISAVRQLGATLVLTAHKVREVERTYGWSRQDCDRFAAVSEWIRRDLQPFTDVPIQVIPNGIDTAVFCPAPEADTTPPIVAWIGRGGAERKHLDTFAAIAPALARAGMRLWVIDPHGPSGIHPRFAAAGRALAPLAERWGAVPYAEMPAMYRQIASSGGCVVSTADLEGLPLTLLEAQACGCTVVASDVRGNNECVSPEHGGVLFPLETPAAELADRVLSTLRDREALRTSQYRASHYVHEQFSLSRMAERYVQLYTGQEQPAVPRSRRLHVRRLSPVWNFRTYLDQRWGVGYTQYALSRLLASHGDWRLAAAAGRASLVTSPTMFLRPSRLAHLLNTQLKKLEVRG